MKIRYRGRLYQAIDGVSPEDIAERYKGEFNDAIADATNNRLYYNAYAASDMAKDGEGVNQGGASR